MMICFSINETITPCWLIGPRNIWKEKGKRFFCPFLINFQMFKYKHKTGNSEIWKKRNFTRVTIKLSSSLHRERKMNRMVNWYGDGEKSPPMKVNYNTESLSKFRRLNKNDIWKMGKAWREKYIFTIVKFFIGKNKISKRWICI